MHRANVLLDRIVSQDEASVNELAMALMASPDIVLAYRGGLEIPIERQILLAAYAIERAPKFARLARSLRGQIGATIRFAAGETVRHAGPPPPTARSRWG
jgi:hypothetical protein